MDAVRADGLTKRYGATLALDSLDLTVAQGEVYGCLGPNRRRRRARGVPPARPAQRVSPHTPLTAAAGNYARRERRAPDGGGAAPA